MSDKQEIINKLTTSDKAKVFDIIAAAYNEGKDVAKEFSDTLDWLTKWK